MDNKRQGDEKRETTIDETVVAEQEKLIALIRTVHHKGTLEYLHTFIKLLLEKWWGY